MNPQAITRLRRSFILVATASFFVVIAFMALATSISNVMAIRDQANATIDAIIDAGGNVPTESNYAKGVFHEEANYGLRFFTVSFDKSGEVTDVDVSHIALVDTFQALELARMAADPNTLTGLTRYENYFVKEGETRTGSMVVFLDCSFQLENAQEVVTRTLMLSVAAFIITLVSIVIFSKRAIRSEEESMRRQQQFMTNASHELKTPISVIRANTELTEMISGETEWTQSTLKQVDRLDGLVRDLMTIVRGEERSGAEGGLSNVDVTMVVEKAVDSFNSVAQQNGIGLERTVDQGVELTGSEASIEQLVCLLMDNAIKYCDEDGSVNVRLSKARIGRGCTLAVSNDFAAGADVDYRQFFDRFYRADEAHENQQGYGIGLSVAESICTRYHGSIKASWKAGVITFTCTLKDA